jgi:hypothetical protein
MTRIYDLDLGHPHMGPDMGPRFGTPIWERPQFGTPIYDFDLGHPHLGPRFGTPI